MISVVSEIELLVQPIREARWLEIEKIRVLLGSMQIMNLDRAIARSAAQVRAEHRLSLADAAIVATALSTGCAAIVGNDERCAQRVRDIPYVLLDDLVQEKRS